MSSLPCPVCGVVSELLMPSGRCATCHGRDDETNPVSHFAPTAPAGTFADTRDAAGDANPFAGCLPLAGFRCIGKIGGGGMGEVYRAEEMSLSREVAVKRLRQEAFTPPAVRRFAGEAALLAKVDDERVVKLHQFVPDPADPLIVMEYVPGEALSEKLKRDGRLPPADAARLMALAARGVHAAHRAGVIHRDLKPGNILLTPTGRVKVVDFGLAKDLTAGRGNSPTVTGRIVGGTAGFVAPEQVDERPQAAEVGVHTDVFGLGACLYAALTGVPPFPPGTANLFRVLTDDFTPPREKVKGLPPDLDAVVCRCLEKDPAKRYATAAAVADELERFGRGESTEAKPQPLATRVWAKARRTPRGIVIAWAVAAVVIVAAVGAAAFLPFGKTQTPEEKAKAIQDEYRRELRAGRPVTLVGETGLPRHHVWRLGSPELSSSWTGDGSCAYETVGHTLLELLDDAGVDGYLLRAEVRQLNARRQPAGGPAQDDEGQVGIFVGFTRLPDGGGGWVTSMHRLSFSDFDPKYMSHPDGAVTDQAVRSAGAMFFSGEAVPPTSRFITAGRLFRPSRARPGEWRVVEFEVSADGITPRWGNNTIDPTLPLQGPMPLDPHKTGELMQKKVADTFPGRGLQLPAWSPRQPLGIYCGSSAVSVRNVTVSPFRPH